MTKEQEILETIENHARISTKDLAKALNVGEAEVEKSLKKLEKDGVINGYRTVIDWEKFGQDYVSAYIDVKIQPEVKTGFDEIANQLASYDVVEEVCVASGEYDLTIKIRGKNIKEISSFVTEVLAPKKAVVATYTHFILKKFKESGFAMAKPGKNDRLLYSP